MFILNTSFIFCFYNFWPRNRGWYRRLPYHFRRLLTKNIFKLIIQISKRFKFVIRKLSFNCQKLTFNLVKKLVNLGNIIRFYGVLHLNLFLNLNLWTVNRRFLKVLNFGIFRLIFDYFRNRPLLIFNFQ